MFGKGLAVRYRYSLAAQMNRAAISIVSNIAEGAGRCRPGEYRYHVGVARGSLAELETQILLGRRMNVIREGDSDSVIQLVEETGKLLSGLVRRLSPPRGTRAPAPAPSTSAGTSTGTGTGTNH